MSEDWKDNIRDFCLIEGKPPDPREWYTIFQLSVRADVPFEWFEEQGYNGTYSELIDEMKTAGVRVISFWVWRRWFRNQVTPEWRRIFEEEDRNTRQKLNDEAPSD